MRVRLRRPGCARSSVLLPSVRSAGPRDARHSDGCHGAGPGQDCAAERFRACGTAARQSTPRPRSPQMRATDPACGPPSPGRRRTSGGRAVGRPAAGVSLGRFVAHSCTTRARYANDPDRSRRAPAGHLDRRQGVDDPEARGVRPRGGQAGRPVHALPGAVLRALLLPGPGPPVLRLHRAHPGRPDDEADAGPRQADRHGPRRPDVRGGRARQRASTTTPPRSSTPTGRTSASTARRTSRT